MGGGTFAGISAPEICGFPEESPEYRIIFGSYAQQLEQHLRERKWLDLAYVYWFDEPAELQFDFVRHGFEKLHHFAPGLRGMITKEVEDKLIGGPRIWCSLTNECAP